MKIFLFFILLTTSFLFANDKCERFKTESECLKDATCFWMDEKSCISTTKFVQMTSNSRFSSRSYDPTNGQRNRELIKNIPDPRSRRKRQQVPQKDETTQRPNP